jgi:hypothetical protein
MAYFTTLSVRIWQGLTLTVLQYYLLEGKLRIGAEDCNSERQIEGIISRYCSAHLSRKKYAVRLSIAALLLQLC